MKKIFFSNHTPKKAIDWTSMFLRLSLGLFMLLNHGWVKLSQYDQMSGKFIQFMGLGSSTSLSLAIFAEFFCSFLLILGLFTRWVTIPLMIVMLMALKVKNWQIFGDGNNELAALFFIGFLTILILGPGKYSIDAMIHKSRR